MSIKRECNFCGRCCYTSPCSIALGWVKGAHKNYPCPALDNIDGKYYCGLITCAEDVKFNIPEVTIVNDKIFNQDIKGEMIKEIQSQLKRTITNQCDSVFGTGKNDLRIPIHKLYRL